MLSLSNLSPMPASNRKRKRVGRGQGSGRGGTAARGHKGSKSRSGYGVKMGFEGGQMPLQRRLPKRGFTNVFKKEYVVIGLDDLDRFEEGIKVDRQALMESGLISENDKFVKILANGEISKAVTVSVDKVSRGARQKIEAAGGTIEE